MIEARLTPSIALALLVACAACSRHDGAAEASDTGATATTPATPPAASTPPAMASGKGGPPTTSAIFAAKLAQEAVGRPTGTPRAEDVLAAIVAAGVPLDNQAQHVATTIGAHFCIGATSTLGLRLSACEYDTEAAAAAGRDKSNQNFAAIEHRDITLNKKTSLTVLQAPFTPESQSAHDKAVAAFKKL